VNGGANTALANRLVTNGPVFLSAAQLFLDLTNASDHLPVVADYAIPMPAPLIGNVSFAGSNLVVTVSNSITNSVLTMLMSTNLAMPFSNWIAVAASPVTNGNMIVTAPNAVDPAKPQGFFVFQEK
jgi:hypothetical protein